MSRDETDMPALMNGGLSVLLVSFATMRPTLSTLTDVKLSKFVSNLVFGDGNATLVDFGSKDFPSFPFFISAQIINYC